MQVLYLIKMEKKVKLKKGNKIIANSVIYLDGVIGKGIGMMFHKKGNVVLVAERESKANTSIHTFFCAPLLVAWINSKKVVVDVKETTPFWFYSPKNPAKYVFETTNMRIKIKIGDKIKFITKT